MNPLVIYHSGCMDGLCAAAAFMAMAFERIEDPTTINKDAVPDFAPASYGRPPYDNVADRDVYIVDFCYAPEVLLDMAKTAKSVTVLDHHKTAIDAWTAYTEERHRKAAETGLSSALPDNLHVKFVNDQSGAMMGWQYVLEQGLIKEIPPVITYIQDYDLWKHVYPESKALNAFLSATDAFLSNDPLQIYLQLYRLTWSPAAKENLAEALTVGRSILKANDIACDAIIKRSMALFTVNGMQVPVINCPMEFANEIGERLSQIHPFVVMYEDRLHRNLRKFSLRAKEGGQYSVRTFAERMGGGGHDTAAAFTTALNVEPGSIFKFFA